MANQLATNQSVPQHIPYYNGNYGYGTGTPPQLQAAAAAAQSANVAAIRQQQSGNYFLPPNIGQQYGPANPYMNPIQFNPQQNFMPTQHQIYDYYNQMGGNSSRR